VHYYFTECKKSAQAALDYQINKAEFDEIANLGGTLGLSGLLLRGLLRLLSFLRCGICHLV
jgi:hypothetical protein